MLVSCGDTITTSEIITEKGYVENIQNEQGTSGIISKTTKNRIVANIRFDSNLAKVYDTRLIARLHEGDSAYFKYVIEDIAAIGLYNIVIYDVSLDYANLRQDEDLIKEREERIEKKYRPLKELNRILLAFAIFATVLIVFLKLLRKGHE